MPTCNYCGVRHVIFADWAACNSRRVKAEVSDADLLYAGFDTGDEWKAETEATLRGILAEVMSEIEQGRYDDDPNPYHGTYSEE